MGFRSIAAALDRRILNRRGNGGTDRQLYTPLWNPRGRSSGLQLILWRVPVTARQASADPDEENHSFRTERDQDFATESGPTACCCTQEISIVSFLSVAGDRDASEPNDRGNSESLIALTSEQLSRDLGIRSGVLVSFIGLHQVQTSGQ